MAAAGGSGTATTALNYRSPLAGTITGSTIVPVDPATGGIAAMASSSINLVIDVQGYYTAGNGVAAPGGYVPVAPKRVIDTAAGVGAAKARLAVGSTSTFQIGGTAGVPVGASAVFATVSVTSYDSSPAGYVTPFPTGAPAATGTLHFLPNTTTAFGATVQLAGDGSFQVSVSVSVSASFAAVDVAVDVVGYYTATDGPAGAFTPASTRVYDSRVAPSVAVPAGQVVTVPVAGVAGVPLVGSGISAVAINVHSVTYAGGGAGLLRVWPGDRPEPAVASVTFPAGQSVRNALVIVQPGADGQVRIRNTASSATDVVLDVAGWYTAVSPAVSSGQTITARYVLLQAAAAAGMDPWVSYRYRAGSSGAFTDVPAGSVTVRGGSSHPAGWPVGRNAAGVFDAYVWDTSGVLAGAAAIQVIACYGSSATDTDPVCSVPTTVQVDPAGFQAAYATATVGPGAVSELTGDYTITAVDVQHDAAADALSVSRTLTTLSPPGERGDAAGVFGPGWTAGLQSGGAGRADLRLSRDATTGFVTFTDPDGTASVYQPVPPTAAYPVALVGVGDAAGDGLQVTQTAAGVVTMQDPDGTVTRWAQAAGNTWSVDSVTQPGSSGGATGFVYDAAGLPTQIVAPAPAGVTCTAPYTTPGCRSLRLSYTTVTVAGQARTRLSGVALVAGGVTTAVAAYAYDSDGRLAQQWDPRISPALKTGYTYTAAGRLAGLTPPGQAAWSFAYDGQGRLQTVSRPASGGGTATSTVVYDVPVTGTGAPIDLGAAAAAGWGQTTDLPAVGVAVFAPNRTPAGTTASTVSASDWPWAAIDYLDVNGRAVNTARYGAGAWQTTATQHDGDGTPVWQLSAGNRAQAIAPTGDTDPAVAATAGSAARANLLATTTVVDPLHPGRVTDTYGPTHPVTLADGAVIDARTHRHTDYDQGAPDGADYGLPTTVTVTAQDPGGVEHDPAVHRYGYDAIQNGDPTGWALRAATTDTTQMGPAPSSADLTDVTRYDNAGRVVEHRHPGAAGPADPRTTVTAYYTAAGTGSCVSAAAAGRVCTVGPAAQPTTGAPLPTTRYTYDRYGNVLTATETAGATVRTTTNGYDPAGRPTSSGITVTPTADGGTDLPTTTYGYDPATGLATTVTAGGQTLTTGYTTTGQVATYTDATGTTATYSYDTAGRLTALDDGKATTRYTYDTPGEHRGMPTAVDVAAAPGPSTITATYNPDGAMATRTYPTGLTATTRYTNTGQPASLTYAKDSATWLTFQAGYDPAGRITTQHGPGSAQHYTLDGAGRLTQVQDTAPTGTGGPVVCTTRSYSFDQDSNRTALTTHPADPATGGCTTDTTPTVTAAPFDQADRITTTGYTYDTLGRTLTVPAADATSTGSKTGVTGTLTLGYYTNDMIATQTQAGHTRNYTLDPTQNRIATWTDGTTTSINHYANDSDSPAWTTTGTGFTRNLHGPDGTLAGTQTDTGTITWTLTNLHGDVAATVTNDPAATAPTNLYDTTEYGQPRNPAHTPDTYGYLGTHQRSTDTYGGLTLMGIRLYNPTTGRFLTPDPIPDGNNNPYTYPLDPINQTDLNGMWWKWLKTAARWVGKQVRNHGRLIVHVAIGFAVTTAATGAAFCVGTVGAGCVVIASAGLGMLAGVPAHVVAARLMHEPITARKAVSWYIKSALGLIRKAFFR